MKLITTELTKRFKEVREQYESENPIFVAKFFDPCGSATWYISEYNDMTNVCRAYQTGLKSNKWVFFYLDELESIKRPLGVSIERDIHFNEISYDQLIGKKRISELKKNTSQDKNQELER